MTESMASRQLEKATKLYSIAMKNIKLYMNLLGTDFVVLRPKDNSKWKNVFGGSFSSDDTLENDYEQFTTRLIINQSDMRDVWSRNRDTLETFTIDGNLQVGDEVQYTMNKITYRFKISQKMGFGPSTDTIYSYILSSIIETLDM